MSLSQNAARSQIRHLLTEAATLAYEHGFGDILSYARSKEFIAAEALGHCIAETYAGADAFNQKGEPVEYKSTTAKHCKGAYTGISVFETWEEQLRYLFEEKIAKYPEHYYNRFENGILVEVWKMKGIDVYKLLLPKLEKKFFSDTKSKDPRLDANITWTEIQKYGTKVI
jgi:hypothetical protein